MELQARAATTRIRALSSAGNRSPEDTKGRLGSPRGKPAPTGESADGQPRWTPDREGDRRAAKGGFSETALVQLIARLQHPVTGVPVRDHTWRMRAYRQCFTGTECVDWLLAQSSLLLENRQAAVALGVRLQSAGAFRPLSRSSQEFDDGRGLFQLKSLKMLDDLQYLDDLFREYLLYRGLADTLQTFERDLAADRLHHVSSGRVTAKLLQMIQEFDLAGFRAMWSYLEQTLFEKLDRKHHTTVEKLHFSLQRYYLVNCVQKNKPQRIHAFFRDQADMLTAKAEWQKWFCLPYMPAPHKHADFEVFFTRQWIDTVACSLTNFLSTVMNESPLPKAMLFNVERTARASLEKEVQLLRAQVARLEQLQAGTSPSRPERTERSSVVVGDRSRAMSPTIRGSNLPSMSAEAAGKSPAFRLQEAAVPKVTESRKSLVDGEKVMLGKQRQASVTEDSVRISSTHSYSGHAQKPLTCATFSSGGTHVASGSTDGVVKVWKTNDLQEQQATIPCFSRVKALAWVSDRERVLALGSADGTLRLWDCKKDQLVSELALPSAIDGIACAATGSVCCCITASHTGGGSSVLVYDLDSTPPTLVAEIAPEPATHLLCLALSRKGDKVLVGGDNGTIYAIDVATASQTSWRAHFGPVRSLCFDKQETSVISVGKDRNLLQWNLQSTASPQLSYMYNNASEYASLAFSPFGEYFVVNENDAVKVFKKGTPVPLQSLVQRDIAVCVAWHPSANVLLVATAGGLVEVLHLKLSK